LSRPESRRQNQARLWKRSSNARTKLRTKPNKPAATKSSRILSSRKKSPAGLLPPLSVLKVQWQYKPMDIKDKEMHRVATTAIIYNKAGEFLITKRAMHKKHFPGKWTVPGGG